MIGPSHQQSQALLTARRTARAVELAIKDRDQAILAAWQAGSSTRAIGRFIGVSHGTVHRMIRKQEPF